MTNGFGPLRLNSPTNAGPVSRKLLRPENHDQCGCPKMKKTSSDMLFLGVFTLVGSRAYRTAYQCTYTTRVIFYSVLNNSVFKGCVSPPWSVQCTDVLI